VVVAGQGGTSVVITCSSGRCRAGGRRRPRPSWCPLSGRSPQIEAAVDALGRGV